MNRVKNAKQFKPLDLCLNRHQYSFSQTLASSLSSVLTSISVAPDSSWNLEQIDLSSS